MGKACLPIARMPGTAVALQIFQVAHIACEEALAERGEGDEADRQIARVRAHHLRFLAGKQEVFRLNGAHRMHRVGTADAFQVPLGGARSRSLPYCTSVTSTPTVPSSGTSGSTRC